MARERRDRKWPEQCMVLEKATVKAYLNPAAAQKNAKELQYYNALGRDRADDPPYRAA